jgi:mercuric ion binding protein
MRILAILGFLLIGLAATAQMDTIKIKTSAECDMCKKRIEEQVGITKGVKSAVLDVNTMVLTVIYNKQKTAPEKIKTIINKAGYDADDTKADPKSQKKLPACCRPGGGKDHK